MTTKLMSTKGLRRNKRGGIEGLPMQLMIIILVATLGTGIIVGWMGSIEAPHHIGSVEVDKDIQLSNDFSNWTVKVKVADENGNPLEGAAVVLTGCGAAIKGNTPYVLTDGNGVATFNGLTVNNVSSIRYISVDVSKNGYGENNTARIMVIP